MSKERSMLDRFKIDYQVIKFKLPKSIKLSKSITKKGKRQMEKGKLITQQRFDTIKTVLNSLPFNTNGVGKVYEALGVSGSTVSVIRKSKDYTDYKNQQKIRYDRYKKEKEEKQVQIQTQPADWIPVGNESGTVEEPETQPSWTVGQNADLLGFLNRIEEKVDSILSFIDLEEQIIKDVVVEEKDNVDGLVRKLREKFNLG